MTDYADKPEFRALDDAVRAWAATDEGQLLTGWVLVSSSLYITEADDGAFGTHYVAPPAQNYHQTLGLVTAAKRLMLDAVDGGDE